MMRQEELLKLKNSDLKKLQKLSIPTILQWENEKQHLVMFSKRLTI